MARYLILSCSLNPQSRSRILARMVHDHLAARPGGAELVDLQDYDLPLSDAGACYSHPHVVALTPKVAEAQGIIVATAIYNYDVNAATKNFLDSPARPGTARWSASSAPRAAMAATCRSCPLPTA